MKKRKGVIKRLPLKKRNHIIDSDLTWICLNRYYYRLKDQHFLRKLNKLGFINYIVLKF